MSTTVIIPAYNCAGYLPRAIRSALKCKLHSNIEIIVIDDGSEDDTCKILDNFSGMIRTFANPKNLGLAASLNSAISHCTSEYIVRIDADDYVNEYYCLFLEEFIVQNNYFDAVCCDYLLVNDDEEVLERVDAAVNPIGCGIIFKRSVLNELGGYDPEFRYHEDKELMKRFEKKGYQMGHLKVPLYRYRQHVNNMSKDYTMVKQYTSKLSYKHG